MRLPGTRLLALARCVVDPSSVTSILEPLVADWQREYVSAGSAGRRGLVRARGLFAFLLSAVRCVSITDLPPALRYRAWLTFVLFALVGTVIAVLPYLVRSERRLDILLWLLPSNLVVSLTFATLPVAMMLGATARQMGRSYTTRLTLAMMTVIFVLAGWWVPYANQAFRERYVYRAAEQSGRPYRPPVRGLQEITFSELVAANASGHEAIMSPHLPFSPQMARLELHSRISLPIGATVLGVAGWSLARVGSAHVGRLLFWWFFVASSWLLIRSLGRTLNRWWHAPFEVAVWLPLALWLAAAIVLMRAATSAAGGSDLSAEASAKAEDPPLPVQST